MTAEVVAEYERQYRSHLAAIADALQELIADYLADVSFVDRIVARAKEPERFAEKAERSRSDGSPRYDRPLTEIQDLVGARVIVLYEAAVDPVSSALIRYFQSIEDRELVPESHWQFGYFGRHHVFPLPGDVVPEGVDTAEAPRFFEIQIKTLFQHAWSEAEHDLGYKAPVLLTGEQERLLAFAAAQAWGADRAFTELLEGMGASNEEGKT